MLNDFAKNLNIQLIKILFIFIGLFLIDNSVIAQNQKGQEVKPIKSTEIPVKQEPKPEETNEFEEYDGDEEYTGDEFYDLGKELSIVSVDSSSDSFDGGIVEIEEEMRVDSFWVKIAEYYSVWHPRKINPYGIDPVKKTDTTVIQLFNEEENICWEMPTGYTYPTSRFGPRKLRWHYGIDLKLKPGDSIKSVFDGIVRIVAFEKKGYGKFVVLRHTNGLETLYGHLSKQNVEVGDFVKAGDIIGFGGNTGRSTGPHLHFEVRYEGNPLDPELFFDFNSNYILTNQFEVIPSNYDYVREIRKMVFHKIRPGDTLGHISRKYGVSMASICRLNKISTKSILRVGRRLRIR